MSAHRCADACQTCRREAETIASLGSYSDAEQREIDAQREERRHWADEYQRQRDDRLIAELVKLAPSEQWARMQALPDAWAKRLVARIDAWRCERCGGKRPGTWPATLCAGCERLGDHDVDAPQLAARS